MARKPTALRRALIVMISAAALVAASGRALYAESPAAKPAPAPATPPQPAAGPPPPYQPQLLRMAEIMGALAYLRGLCGVDDGAKFRARMATLLDAEGSSETQRDLLAGAYNRGFQDYQLTYRICTAAADEIVSHFLNELERLAAEVANRYGG